MSEPTDEAVRGDTTVDEWFTLQPSLVDQGIGLLNDLKSIAENCSTLVQLKDEEIAELESDFKWKLKTKLAFRNAMQKYAASLCDYVDSCPFVFDTSCFGFCV